MIKNINELDGYEQFKGYSVSEEGKVFSHFKRHDKEWVITEEPYKELRQAVNRKGYHEVRLSCGEEKKSARIHRLVALAFIPNPNNYPQVDHLDGDKKNNHVSNLEWVTGTENHRRKCAAGLNIVKRGDEHYARTRGYKEGEHHTCRPVVQISKNGDVIAEYKSLRTAERETGIHYTSISKAAHGHLGLAGGYKWKFKGEGSTTIEKGKPE